MHTSTPHGAVAMRVWPQEGSHTPTEGRMTQAIAHVGANLAVAPPPPQQQIGYNAPPPPPPGPPGYPQPPPPMPPQTYQQPYPERPPPGPSPFDNPAPPPGSSPFDEPAGGLGWAVSAEDKARYDEIFASLNPTKGLVSGMAVRPVLERSNLPVDILRQVWNLSDIDRDGCLDLDEFAVAMHLARESTNGKPTPQTLPPNLVPPSKR